MSVEMIGRLIGERYRILRLLGSGGFGSVYLAEDIRLIAKQVVVKVFHPAFTGHSDFTRRYSMEIRALAGLDHPNIIRLLDAGSEGDRLYIVTEYVAGRSLADIPKPLDVDYGNGKNSCSCRILM